MAPSTARPSLAHPDPKTIRSLFNAISAKYDFLNSFLSLGLDRYWRRTAVECSLDGVEHSILDLGVGTGKSLGTFLKGHQFERVVGCDFSESMLRKAKERLGQSVILVACDFHELPFPARSFDLVTGSFILRSVQNMEQFLSEVKRVLAPDGKAVFLELTRPKNRAIWRFLYQPYLKFYVPCVGQLFSQHDHAYQFLSESIQSFAKSEELEEAFRVAGFSNVSARSLSLGAATLVQGKADDIS